MGSENSEEVCDISAQEQPCLPLCCPHGQAWVLDGQSGEEVCGDQVIREQDMTHSNNNDDNTNAAEHSTSLQ